MHYYILFLNGWAHFFMMHRFQNLLILMHRMCSDQYLVSSGHVKTWNLSVMYLAIFLYCFLYSETVLFHVTVNNYPKSPSMTANMMHAKRKHSLLKSSVHTCIQEITLPNQTISSHFPLHDNVPCDFVTLVVEEHHVNYS